MIIYINKSASRRKKPAIFLDRDGTLIFNRPGHYLTKIENIKFYKNVFKALKILKKLGYLLLIITNQSAVARGYLTLANAIKINLKIKNVFNKNRIKIDGIYLCPHKPSDNCKCRKPNTGLIKEALKHHKIDMKNSYVIGDKISDIYLAKKLKIKSIFLKTGHGREQFKKFANKLKNVHISNNILKASMWLKAQTERNLIIFSFVITSLLISTISGHSQAKDEPFSHPFSGFQEVKTNTSVVNSNWYREKLEYEVYWGFFKVGKAFLFVEKTVNIDGNLTYHIVSMAKSSSWMDNFYSVNDRNEAWMDVKSGHSYGYLKSLREGKFKIDEWVIYDTKDMTFLAEKKDSKGKVTRTEGKIPGYVSDILSSLYLVRSKELKPKTDFLITVNTKRTWDLKIVVHKKENVETPSGKFECIVVEPMLGEEGIFVPKKGKQLLVYFTNDNLKIPVMLQAEIFIGSIYAKLVKRHFQQ